MENYFEKELATIKNPVIAEIAREGISILPEYFFTIPASSTGKYHPAFALGEGGLYRHVQASVNIALMLFRIYSFTDDEKDLIITSLMLHDGWKQGENGSKNTTHDHPLIATKNLLEKINTEGNSEKALYLTLICENIASHMGQWTTSKYDSTVLPEPKSRMQKFVHLCDYLSSRKPLEYNFSVDNGA